MLSRKKTNCYPLTHHTSKISPHFLVKCKYLTAGNVAFLQMLVTLKRAGCGLTFVALKMTDQGDKETDHRIGLRR